MSANKLLSGKVALITGGGRGIGQAIATALAKEGAGLALVARKKDQLDETAAVSKEHGAAFADVYPTDLTNGANIDSLAKQLLEKHGAVDILVNNAGMMTKGSTPLDGNPDDWETMIQLNLAAPMRITRLLAPAMVEKGGGTIINLGSVAAVEPMTQSCAYAATKHGLRGWSLSCYQALRHKNIKVVLINPAMVNTPMIEGSTLKRERMLQPSDIAEAAMLAFKSSPACVPEEITLRLTLSPYE
jgi:short-subunit dehydrogenase